MTDQDTEKKEKPKGGISEDKLLAAIDAKLTNAYGSEDNSTLSQKRTEAIESYLGLNTNPAPEGRSQVVDRSVYETIHTMLPSLVRIFAGSSDEVCKFVPVGPEDEANAEQTTAYVNHHVTQKNQWEQIVADWIFDALLSPNSYCMPYWDEAEHIEREEYEGQTDEQIALLMQDDELTILQHSSYPDPDAQPQIDPMTMAPMEGAQLHDIVAERVNKNGRLKLCVLPYEHCIVDGDCGSWMLKDTKFFEYREKKTIAELRSMGLDVPEDIGDSIDPNDTSEDLARDRMGENTSQAKDNGEGPLRKVTTRMIWVYADAERNEEPRMYYCILVGRTVLHAEPCGRIQVSSMTAQPMPHRHPGMSIAETVKDLQEIGTAITRGGLDNLYLANNGRHVVSDQVNLADFLDSRPGGLVRMLNGALPANGHVMPLTHPFAFDQIIGSLEYFDQKRQNRVGTSRYFSGTDAGAINKTASGIAQLTNASAQRVEHVARMMAPAVEELFSICHELLLKHSNKAEIIKLQGKWVPVDPAAWQTKRDVRISVGVGAGNKDALLGALNMMFQEQVMLAQSPMGLVKPENLYATVIEQAKLMGFANPDKFYTNPMEQPAQQQGPPPEVQVKGMELQHDAQKTQLIESQKAATERARLDHEKWKTDQDNQVKVFIAQLQSQTQQVLEGMKQQMAQVQTAMEGQRMQMEGQQQMHGQRMDMVDKELAYLNQMQGQRETAMKSMGEFTKVADSWTKQLQELQSKIEGGKTAKVEKVRDPTGKLIGAKVHQADGNIRDVRMDG